MTQTHPPMRNHYLDTHTHTVTTQTSHKHTHPLFLGFQVLPILNGHVDLYQHIVDAVLIRRVQGQEPDQAVVVHLQWHTGGKGGSVFLWLQLSTYNHTRGEWNVSVLVTYLKGVDRGEQKCVFLWQTVGLSTYNHTRGERSVSIFLMYCRVVYL